ncbi:hypothetical protein VHUM_00896 [Vanrija humicola]|uniref:Peroxidase n=1 Tax=Vanrija humicola TaxID=5417 RepID=A0A7D8Z2V5_VANHU|nr:hypothetical protein VHUM_00896 [Vanrija humicola]
MSLRITPVLRNVATRRVVVAGRAATPLLRRGFADQAAPPPPPPPKKEGGGNGLLLALGAAAAAGAAYYFYNQESSAKSTAPVEPTKADYEKVYNAITDIFDKEGYDDGSLAPIILRLAWHASGTYDKADGTGGSNHATMRFPNEAGHGGNAGLGVARDALEPIKKQFPWISYGDLWTLAGVAAIQETGGPVILWRPGRIDGVEAQQTPDGRLPDAAQGQSHIRDIFGRMGFNDQEMVALIGAHALGRCHTDRSGYEGPWTFSPVTFSNEFYNLLLNDAWQWKKWKGPAQYEDKKTKSLMMLPADMAIVQDKEFKKWAQVYAKDEQKFFDDFSKAFATLLELGVPKDQFKSEPYKVGQEAEAAPAK